ncbi:MAG: hypothetical protein QF454_04835 [Candidatus Thalassarchaeaceae archaeon]|nr:hypothetical protein [Candidatus Thalassarchaeaceae archaeon]
MPNRGGIVMANKNMIEVVKSIPNQLILIIFGFILVVNSNHTDIMGFSSKLEQLISNNMELVGRVLIIIGFVKIMVTWYLAHVADQEEPKENNI